MIFHRNKTKHKLEIGQESTLTHAVKIRKSTKDFSPIRKIVGTIVALSIAATTAFIGVSMVPTPGQETASADWLTDLMCQNNQSESGIYGGSAGSSDAAKGRTPTKIAEDKSQPWNSLIPVSVPETLKNLTAAQGTRSYTQEMTALERYGYFAPSFESWKGLAITDPNNKDNPVKDEGGQLWYGSGGGSSLETVGPGVVIKDVGQTIMFSSSGILCVGAAFSGGNAGNMIMFFPKLAIAIASTLYMMTDNLSLSGDSMLAPIGDVIETMIIGDGTNKGLKDLLFLDFMLVMIMLGGIVVAWQGLLKGQVLQAIQSVGWMLLVGITGILMLSNPLWLSNTMEKGLDLIETAVEEATLQTNSMSPECSLPSSYEQATERKVVCSLWLNSIYKPWVNGQFGKDYRQMITESSVDIPDPSTGRNWIVPAPTDISDDDLLNWFSDIKNSADNGVARGEALKTSLLNANPGSTASRGVFTKFAAEKPLGTKNVDSPEFKNWAFYHMHTQSNWDAPTGMNVSEVAFNQLALNANVKWRIAMEAVPNALLSFIAAAAPTVFMVVIAGTLISFQIILVVLIVLAPFFFTIGFFPGWGRRILMRWFELIASLFVKRVILVLFLFIFLKIYISILELDIDWGFQILFITVLTIVALTQKEQITQMVTSQINFGSYNSFGTEESMKQSAVAGVLGGYYAGKAGARAVGNVTKGLRRQKGGGSNSSNVVPQQTEQATPTTQQTTQRPVTTPETNQPPNAESGPSPQPEVAIPSPNNQPSTPSGSASTPPEQWRWDSTEYDDQGNLVGAVRYNEDGSGKVYHGGETYTVNRGADGKPYAIKDSDGSQIDSQTFAQLGRKRSEGERYAQSEAQQRALEGMPTDSESYSEGRSQRAAEREKQRQAAIEGQRQAALEAPKAVGQNPGNSSTVVTGPPRSGETEAPTGRGRPSPQRENPEIVLDYDPVSNTYTERTSDNDQ